MPFFFLKLFEERDDNNAVNLWWSPMTQQKPYTWITDNNAVKLKEVDKVVELPRTLLLFTQMLVVSKHTILSSAKRSGNVNLQQLYLC